MKRLLILSVVFVCAAQPVMADDPPRNIQETITFLQKLQTKSGAFLLQPDRPGEKPGQPTLRSTSAAVRALGYFGGKVPDKQAAIKFVAACHDPKSGGFANTPGGKPDVFVTSVGIMAVVALEMPTEKYAEGVVKYLSENAKTFEDIRIAVAGLESIKARSLKTKAWLEVINKMQNPDGTFGKDLGQARDTASAVVAILRLGGKLKNKNNVVKVLKDGQRLNGAYGKADDPITADLETTYRVMRAFYMLNELPPDVEALRSYVEKCRNADGGYSVSPAAESNVPGTYYAAIIHHWLKDKK